MKVTQHIEKANGKPLFSFEILPPLKGQNIQSIFDSIDPLMEFKPPLKYNVLFRTGINESDIIGIGQKPFYNLSFYADKQFARKSKVQFGLDAFYMLSLKEYIKYKSVAFPNESISENTDFKRVGLFTGYELQINKFSVEAQMGYYVYSPFKFLGPLYQRIGTKYQINKTVFSSFSLKTHAANAEALEFGIGVKL